MSDANLPVSIEENVNAPKAPVVQVPALTPVVFVAPKSSHSPEPTPAPAQPVQVQPVTAASPATLAVEEVAIEIARNEPVPVDVAPVDVAPLAPVTVSVAIAASIEVESIPTNAQAIPAVMESLLPETSLTDSVTEADVVPSKKSAKKLKKAERAALSDGEIRFVDLALSDPVQQAIANSGYEKPTAIQAQIIPHVLEGRDVLAQSQTGTGKTAAFALPILSRISTQGKQSPQTLVLAPTRELAIQVAKSFQTYGQQLSNFNVATIYGGQDYEVQFRQLHRGAQVVVGTPGRVIDHINRGSLDLSGLQTLVLDEADEMLNMGFLEDVQFVLDRAPAERQIALFSATLPGPIRHIAERYLRNPVQITIKQKTMTAESIRQRAVFAGNHEKLDALIRFLEAETSDGVIVFTKTKDATVTVAEQLSRAGLRAIALNGDMPQKVRERTIEQLKAGRLDILVATDVAARGLDVPRISHVFNFDLPHDSESYIHRIGRTGRAGRDGQAIIFLTPAQRGKLRLIERATNQPIEIVNIPSAHEINAIRVARFKQQITEVVASEDLSMFQNLVSGLVSETETSPEVIAAALAHLGQNGRPFFMVDRPKRGRDARDTREPRGERSSWRDERRGDSRDGGGRRGDSPGSFGSGRERTVGRDHSSQRGASNERGMSRYRIEVGSRDGVKPANIVGAVANEAGISGRDIGQIKILDEHSYIDLPEGMPQDVFETLQETKINGKAIRLAPVAAGSGPSKGERPDFGGDRRGPKKTTRPNKSFDKKRDAQPNFEKKNFEKPATRPPFVKAADPKKSTAAGKAAGKGDGAESKTNRVSKEDRVDARPTPQSTAGKSLGKRPGLTGANGSLVPGARFAPKTNGPRSVLYSADAKSGGEKSAKRRTGRPLKGKVKLTKPKRD